MVVTPCWRDFLGLDAHTVARGRQQLLDQDVVSGRTRRPGGGRPHGKKTADLIAVLHCLLEHDTAGDPMTGLRWSRRTTTTIAEELGNLGISLSPKTVARLLHQMGYSLRVNHKQISTNSSPDRNLSSNTSPSCATASSAVICPSSAWTQKTRIGRQLQKSWPSLGARSPPLSSITTSARIPSESPFPMGSTMSPKIEAPWSSAFPTILPPSPLTPSLTGGDRKVRGAMPASRQMLILADTGGSNGCRCYAWKTEIQSN